MSFYPRTNFAKGNLTGTLPTAVATSITLASGKGALFPDPDTEGSFPAVLWNVTDYADPSDDPDVEIVLVTDKITDTFQITRAQEGTTAKAHNTTGKTYRIALVPTAAVIQQLIDALVKTYSINELENVTIGDTAPASPQLNDLWIDLS